MSLKTQECQGFCESPSRLFPEIKSALHFKENLGLMEIFHRDE